MSKFYKTDLETNHYETTTGSAYGWNDPRIQSNQDVDQPTPVCSNDTVESATLEDPQQKITNEESQQASILNGFGTDQNQNGSLEITQKMEADVLKIQPASQHNMNNEIGGETTYGHRTFSTTVLQTNVPQPVTNGKVLTHQEAALNDLGANINDTINASGQDLQRDMQSLNLADDRPSNPNAIRISRITQELAQKLADNVDEQVAVFFHQFNTNHDGFNGEDVTVHDDKWKNSAFLRTVFSTRNTLFNSKGSFIKWDIIKQSLLDLVRHCTKGAFPENVDILMENALSRYDADVQSKTDFMTLTHPDIKLCLPSTIPIIVQHALKLPALLATPIPFLKAHENKTIYMTKRLVASLLANAFFCTLPPEKDEMPDINFHRIFNTAARGNGKAEKLKCILNYFQQIGPPGRNPEKDDQIISFERRVIHDRKDWARSTKNLTNVNIEPIKRIEEAHGCLQVDFANKRVGGAILNEGAVMEEIMFATCPDLIISRLFTEPLKDEEVLVINGAEQYSNYEGYCGNFHYAGPTKGPKYRVENLGRICTQIVVMDALKFKQYEMETQFEQRNIDRELHKAYVGFLIPIGGLNIPIATGNWGCGVFNGDVEIKFLIQWMAASEAGRTLMIYHTIGDAMQAQEIKSIEEFLTKKNINIGELYNAMVGYQKRMSRYPSLFVYLKNEFGNK
ncbi:unnamed protein product [Orchesella dallaii]|uniref:poly(ADP-ribose) glycohydrolase n=1 Tax=Orchesella dallaii TaxID=48710 RepID=A0ABP1RUS1_9HEXA